ncbi:pyruvate ferredoxin oxidoreductase delta subunit [Maledivibacter halophilus]|uniref:Pyruvate ferredoxin oxidoreductase delta subunit n=2 Tax=Maledivibacter halophilus TaxID=36842 RepID=A0A1T5KGJ6_9FIRM|nr:pyruvate ferredoxin oxidoreductase delta subunit [Maledivibacter halophilus]
MQNQQEKHMKQQKSISDRYRGPLSNVLTNANTGIWRFKRPVVNHEECIKCKMCVEYCPCGVIDKETIGIDYYFCKGCGICVEICPKKAIDFVSEKDILAKEENNG